MMQANHCKSRENLVVIQGPSSSRMPETREPRGPRRGPPDFQDYKCAGLIALTVQNLRICPWVVEGRTPTSLATP